MSLRAARQPRPKGVSPYSARKLAGSCETSNAFSCSELIINRARARVSRCRVASTRESPAVGEGALENLKVGDPRQVSGHGHAGRYIRESSLWITGLKRVKLSPQESASARPLASQNRDVAGDVSSPDGQFMAADRTDRGVFDSGIGSIARFHQIRPALVIPFLADHRPHQCDRIHLGRPVDRSLRRAVCREPPWRSLLSQPAIRVSGWGSNVSSWLGPPPSHKRIIDCAGSRDCSASSG